MPLRKKEAAKRLGVSVRKLELLATQGRLSRRYIPGKRGREVVFDEAELDALKKQLEAEAEKRTVPASHKQEEQVEIIVNVVITSTRR